MLRQHVLPSKLAFKLCEGKAETRKNKTIHTRNNHDNQNTVAVRWASASTNSHRVCFVVTSHFPFISIHEVLQQTVCCRPVVSTQLQELGSASRINPELQSQEFFSGPPRGPPKTGVWAGRPEPRPVGGAGWRGRSLRLHFWRWRWRHWSRPVDGSEGQRACGKLQTLSSLWVYSYVMWILTSQRETSTVWLDASFWAWAGQN